jgi:Tol biopolymer transport system component
MAIWSLTRTEPRTPQDFRVVPVTRMPGKEFQPAISPDGRRIAFLWSREGVSPPGVWVKEISGESPRALTAAEGHHSSPAWSSDGRRLAYLRVGRTATQIVIADAITGSEQIVSELPPSRLVARQPVARGQSCPKT